MERQWFRGVLACGLLTCAILSFSLPPAGAARSGSRWRDVRAGSRASFARAAIDDVAGRHDWMRDFGRRRFRPVFPESRERLARAVVRAFAPNHPPAKGVRFVDLPRSDPFYRFASVAVAKRWMTVSHRRFSPKGPVHEYAVSRALALALGLRRDVVGANGIHLRNGTRLPHPLHFGAKLIGRAAGFWFNHDPSVRGDSEAFDVVPGEALTRADVAYALHRARTLGRSAHRYVDQYANLDVGSPRPAIQKVIRFGIRYVGYPYVYAGEWDTRSPRGYCCGTQLQGGFDCSGLTWWLLRSGDSMWSNERIRGYRGWKLPQRSSSQMAASMRKKARIPFGRLRPGDLMLYGSHKKPSSIYHVDVYIGNGWALDSGGNGVWIAKVSSGWFRDTFQYGRRL